jgi:hypothetical protein
MGFISERATDHPGPLYTSGLMLAANHRARVD